MESKYRSSRLSQTRSYKFPYLLLIYVMGNKKKKNDIEEEISGNTKDDVCSHYLV